MIQEVAFFIQEQMTFSICYKNLIPFQSKFKASIILDVADKILEYAEDKKENYKKKEHLQYHFDCIRSFR
jgi:hypothetical protein